MNRSTTLTPKQREDWMAHRWSSPTYAVMCSELVDALLARVFQGKKRRIRNHMLGVCAKVSRHWGKPWMDSQLALAWEEGYLRGAIDNECDLECADNPYAPTDSGRDGTAT